MAKAKKLKVPKRHMKRHWNYNEVQKYLEKLHGKNFRDYAGRYGVNAPEDDTVPYQDFWHWVCDLNEVHNGCYIRLPEWDYYYNNQDTEPWKKEIMKFFKDFLGDDYHERMWVEW